MAHCLWPLAARHHEKVAEGLPKTRVVLCLQRGVEHIGMVQQKGHFVVGCDRLRHWRAVQSATPSSMFSKGITSMQK